MTPGKRSRCERLPTPFRPLARLPAMPPRIAVLSSCLRATTSKSPCPLVLPIRSFAATARVPAQTLEREKLRQLRDPYLIAQRARKKAANLSRRAELDEARAATLGDPVRGIPTPFVESFATGEAPAPVVGATTLKEQPYLNYALNPTTVERQLRRSQKLAVPLSDVEPPGAPAQFQWSESMQYDMPKATQASSDENEAQKQKDHARAAEAIARITALENGSSKDRMRVNRKRCIETFGRHQTDKIFPPKAPTLQQSNGSESHPVRPATNVAATKKRIGPDTGSAEVQIALLTAKIKTLSDVLDLRGKGDKHNQRNLRLLVHRRQKMLKYLRRKERGGPRWQHCIETLGLTEGTWKGEISL